MLLLLLLHREDVFQIYKESKSQKRAKICWLKEKVRNSCSEGHGIVSRLGKLALLLKKGVSCIGFYFLICSYQLGIKKPNIFVQHIDLYYLEISHFSLDLMSAENILNAFHILWCSLGHKLCPRDADSLDKKRKKIATLLSELELFI